MGDVGHEERSQPRPLLLVLIVSDNASTMATGSCRGIVEPTSERASYTLTQS